MGFDAPKQLAIKCKVQVMEFKELWDLHQVMLASPSLYEKAREAAVVGLIQQLPKQEPQIILIKRNEYEGAHSGQMAFPGGKKDSSDIDLRETATREVYEEIGIELQPKDLKPLKPHWVMVSNYWVQPYYAIVNKKLEFSLNKREINRIFEIPVSFFKDPKQIDKHQLTIQDQLVWAPRFVYEDQVIWGATALFLYQMFHLEETKIKID
jgi:8-oxo-dGTP pyrophosphatase MutT (NUDIX family)